MIITPTVYDNSDVVHTVEAMVAYIPHTNETTVVQLG